MKHIFEELDHRVTPIGELSLRRRTEPSLGVEVHEIKLGDEFLMSSLFTVGEIALGQLGLAELPEMPLDVAVGGLGLGYTAQAVLADARVKSLVVIEALEAVIEWHQQKLLPLGAELTADPRLHLVQADFFVLAACATPGFHRAHPGRRHHAILVDIDHSPRCLLAAGHAEFYTTAGLRRLARHLHPGGVFALWSNDPPDVDFMQVLAETFVTSFAHVVNFHNPLQNRTSTNTVYTARLAPTPKKFVL